MALPNIFSRRQRQRTQSGDDVLVYDQLPQRLRVQITHVWDDALGLTSSFSEGGESVLTEAVRLIRKEVGRYHLTSGFDDYREELFNWFVNEKHDGLCLDAIDIVAQLMPSAGHSRRNAEWTSPQQHIDEINARLLEASIGYQVEGGELIRIDSQFAHAEVVKPALALLRRPDYAAANREFVEAHRLYRTGDNEKALTECCKAFESTMKVIMARRRWAVAPNATAKALLDAIFTNGLIPEYAQGGLNSLRSLLEGSIATLRNRTSGHGAGTTARAVSRHLAAYQIHQTAAAILLLVQADDENP